MPSADASNGKLSQTSPVCSKKELEDLSKTKPYNFWFPLVKDLLKSPNSDGFSKPVSEIWKPEEIPDYFDVIDTPMDLGTIHSYLETGMKYAKNEGESVTLDEMAILSDIRTVFTNCTTYNEPDSDYHGYAVEYLRIVDNKIGSRMKGFHRVATIDKDGEQAMKADSEEEARKKRRRENDAARRKRQKEKRESKKQKRAQQRAKKREEEPVRTMQTDQQDRLMSLIGEGEVQERVLDEGNEISFRFADTKGKKPKAGVECEQVTRLKMLHREKMAEWKLFLKKRIVLEKKKMLPMKTQEKRELCDTVQQLSPSQLKEFLGLLATGMNDETMKDETMLEIDIDMVDNATLRELQGFVQNPEQVLEKATRNAENEVASIETMILCLGYVDSAVKGEPAVGTIVGEIARSL